MFGGGGQEWSPGLVTITALCSLLVTSVASSPAPPYDPVLSLLAKYPAYSAYFVSRSFHILSCLSYVISYVVVIIVVIDVKIFCTIFRESPF